MKFAAAVIVSFAVGLAAGCAGPPRSADARYETVAASPAQDVALARREHAAALRSIDAGKWDDAEATLKRALVADVMFGPAHNSLGHVYFHGERYYLAAWEFQYASKLMPTQPEPRNNLGLVFEATGKLDEAIAAYENALSLGPDDAEIVGNATRARFRRGDGESILRPMLVKLLTLDARPGWIEWAHRTLDRYDQRRPSDAAE